MEKEPGNQTGEATRWGRGRGRGGQANQPARAKVPQLVPHVQAAQWDGALRSFAHSDLARAGGECFGVLCGVLCLHANTPNRLASVLGSIAFFLYEWTLDYNYTLLQNIGVPFKMADATDRPTDRGIYTLRKY